MRAIRITAVIIAVLIAFAWIGVFQHHQTRTQALLASWNQVQMQVVREAARAVEAWLGARVLREGADKDLAEQEAFRRFIAPIQLLKNGDAWIYNRDYVIYDQSGDFPDIYLGKSIAQIFEMQKAHGASHYEELVEGVLKGTEGVGWYVWLPDKGREFAAWTTIKLADDSWTIGLSTPESEILAAAGADERFRRELVGAGIITALLLALWAAILWGQRAQRREVSRLNREVAKNTDQLSQTNRELIRRLEQARKAEDALLESEARFRSLSENAPDIIYTLDTAGRLDYVNPAWRRILGHEPREVLGRFFVDFSPPGEARGYVRIFKRVRDGRELIRAHRGRLLAKDGRTVLMDMSAAPHFDPDGRPSGLVGTIKDVTEQEELERQLHHSQKMQAVGTLAGGVAHEFNNILTAVRGFAQLMADDPRLNPGLRPALARINQATQRAAGLSGSMLGLSRLESGEKEPVDPRGIISGVAEVLERTFPAHIKQTVELSPQLPPIMAHPSQLEQVLLNLCLNARDAMPQGGGLKLAARLTDLDEDFCRVNPWARPGTHLTISVEDTGEGIAPEKLERIFEPFFTTKEPGSGTGLGLSLAYSMVKSHEGGIQVDSTPGRGSRFCVYLPVHPGVAQPRPAIRPAALLPRGRGQRLLLVDDEEPLRDMARQALENQGYQVEEAADGLEGLDAYRAGLEKGRRFDLVLLDMGMPRLDGRGFLEGLARLDPGARVVVATGMVETEGALDPGEALMAGVLKKPYDLAALLAAVDQALNDRPDSAARRRASGA